MENPTTIAIDLSKNVFEIAIERQGRICERKRLNRRQTITFLSQCPKATILMETCGSSHYFGRVAAGIPIVGDHGLVDGVGDALTRHRSRYRHAIRRRPKPRIHDHVTTTGPGWITPKWLASATT
jgi:hypothetical protein